MPDQLTAQWCVHIQGPDDLLPALSRGDAYRRAHRVNAVIVADVKEDLHFPDCWALPLRYGEDGLPGCPYPADITAEQVEGIWAEWEQ